VTPWVAALYVETDGVYYGLENVDPWDIERDARTYPGPHPVVAHPPCSTWCQLVNVNKARWGTTIGDDGGTFAAALDAVRTWGGVLEHPAYSIAWTRYGLPIPGRNGWTQGLDDPGMSTEVSQAAYGHDAAKKTWLYAVGVDPVVLDWRNVRGTAVVGAGVNSGECVGRGRSVAPNRTPPAFRDVLIALARSAAVVAA
jgi:hypothetical protein